LGRYNVFVAKIRKKLGFSKETLCDLVFLHNSPRKTWRITRNVHVFCKFVISLQSRVCNVCSQTICKKGEIKQVWLAFMLAFAFSIRTASLHASHFTLHA